MLLTLDKFFKCIYRSSDGCLVKMLIMAYSSACSVPQHSFVLVIYSLLVSVLCLVW